VDMWNFGSQKGGASFQCSIEMKSNLLIGLLDDPEVDFNEF